MWCDSKDHSKNDCQELTEALRERWVKFIGEPRKKRLAFFDDGEGVSLNFGKGGMKALVEKHRGKAEVSVMMYEQRIYPEEQEKIGESYRVESRIEKMDAREEIR